MMMVAIEVFVKGSDNQLYHIWQTSQHGNWSGWESLGGALSSNIPVVKNAYHGLEAFVKWNNNQLYHIWQTSQHGNWSGWESLGRYNNFCIQQQLLMMMVQ